MDCLYGARIIDHLNGKILFPNSSCRLYFKRPSSYPYWPFEDGITDLPLLVCVELLIQAGFLHHFAKSSQLLSFSIGSLLCSSCGTKALPDPMFCCTIHCFLSVMVDCSGLSCLSCYVFTNYA